MIFILSGCGAWGHAIYWQVDKRMYHADDICVAQTYLDLYRKYGKEEMLIPTRPVLMGDGASF